MQQTETLKCELRTEDRSFPLRRPTESDFCLAAQLSVRQIQDGLLRSVYGHDNVVRYDDETPVLVMNCYGYIDYLLGITSPEARQELRLRMDMMKEDVPPSVDNIPCPFNMVALFEASRAGAFEFWNHVEHDDVRPGDIMVYLPPDYTPTRNAELTAPTHTHAMIVQEHVCSFDGTDVYLIIDCTRRNHNTYSDSRRLGGNAARGGIGRSHVFVKQNSKTGLYDRMKWYPRGRVKHKKIVFGRVR